MNNRKKILVFIDWFLPGYRAGGPIRSCANLINHLADYFDFYVITRNTDYLSSNPYLNIESDKWIYCKEYKCSVYYLSSKNLSVKNIKRITSEIEVDEVYINGIFSFYFSLLPLIICRKQRLIIAVRGMLAPAALRLKFIKKKLFLELLKIFGLYNKVLFHATNDDEKNQIFKNVGKNVNIKVASNLAKATKSENKLTYVDKSTGKLKMIMPARIAPEKNTFFALDCLLDMVWDGEIILDLYGAIYDEDYWTQCKKLITELPKNVRVEYKGVLKPEDMDAQLSEYHFMYLPTKGENFGHVILESLIAGVPVLISDKTPWKNLVSDNIGYDLPLNKEVFAKRIASLLELDNNSYQEKRRCVYNYGKTLEVNKDWLNQNIQLFS